MECRIFRALGVGQGLGMVDHQLVFDMIDKSTKFQAVKSPLNLHYVVIFSPLVPAWVENVETGSDRCIGKWIEPILEFFSQNKGYHFHCSPFQSPR